MAKLLTRVKDPTKKEEVMDAVYKIKCICGDFLHRGVRYSTRRKNKGTQSTCKYAHFDRSPVAEHAWKDGDHQINWDDVDIIDRAQGMTERRVKETIYIGLAPPGLTLNRNWFRTITHHHESCQGPTVTEVNKHLDNYSYIIFRLY